MLYDSCTVSLFVPNLSPPRNQGHNADEAGRPPRAYTKGLDCFQPKGSAACLMRRPYVAFHYDPKQRHGEELATAPLVLRRLHTGLGCLGVIRIADMHFSRFMQLGFPRCIEIVSNTRLAR